MTEEPPADRDPTDDSSPAPADVAPELVDPVTE
jgi:hypothetical protein